MSLPFLLVFLSVVHLGLGAIFTAPEQVDVTAEYDFIVVGAGTAGCVVAARLTENPAVKVLLIEAGVSDNGTDSSTIYTPLLAGTAAGTELDWNYTTTAQAGLDGRDVEVPRGFVLGGSSSINGLIYARGSKEEYERLATVPTYETRPKYMAKMA
ncbi:hypothetical protein DFH06DRAFT_1311846, partial [Mycena polygramma]